MADPYCPLRAAQYARCLARDAMREQEKLKREMIEEYRFMIAGYNQALSIRIREENERARLSKGQSSAVSGSGR